MKLRIYLDTSVISALHDYRYASRQEDTQFFWNRLNQFEVSTSEIAREELENTQDFDKRRVLLETLKMVVVHPLTREMKELAGRYISDGIFTETMEDDAFHVAAAVLLRNNILVSWNFKHLVNRTRRAKINSVNTILDLPGIEIVAPPEL